MLRSYLVSQQKANTRAENSSNKLNQAIGVASILLPTPLTANGLFIYLHGYAYLLGLQHVQLEFLNEFSILGKVNCQLPQHNNPEKAIWIQ